MFGFFVNTLPIRCKVDILNDTINSYMSRMKTTFDQVMDNASYPFDEIVKNVNIERDLSRTPIYQIYVAWQNQAGMRKSTVGDITINEVELSSYEESKTDIDFNVSVNSDSYDILCTYNTSIFKQETVQRWVNNIYNALVNSTENQMTKISDLDIMTYDDMYDMLIKFNDTEKKIDQSKSIIEMFENCVREHPDKIALEYRYREITYSDMHNHVCEFARVLKQHGVDKNVIVPICIKRGFEMIIGIWAVLKAGGAYVPIDPTFPEERIKFILDESLSSFFVSSEDTVINANVPFTRLNVQTI